MAAIDNLGPLTGLVGNWEGDQGIDVSYHHEEGAPGETPFREEVSFSEFGPVDNGQQHLYGLDYRMQAWRIGEADAFHMEIGYWLWDAAAGQVMRSFMVPRGTLVLAGGSAAEDATSFSMEAEVGSETYGVLSNKYLAEAARTVKYECEITIGDDTWSYFEDSVLEMNVIDGLYHHTDKNTLHRVG